MSNAHSAELAYLHDFTAGDRPLTPVQTALATRMKRYWGAFARSGAPIVPGQTPWPATGNGSGAAGVVLTLHPEATRPGSTFASDHRCAFWQTRPSGRPL